MHIEFRDDRAITLQLARELVSRCVSPETLVQALNQIAQYVRDDEGMTPDADNRPWRDIAKRLERNFGAWSFKY